MKELQKFGRLLFNVDGKLTIWGVIYSFISFSVLIMFFISLGDPISTYLSYLSVITIFGFIIFKYLSDSPTIGLSDRPLVIKNDGYSPDVYSEKTLVEWLGECDPTPLDINGYTFMIHLDSLRLDLSLLHIHRTSITPTNIKYQIWLNVGGDPKYNNGEVIKKKLVECVSGHCVVDTITELEGKSAYTSYFIEISTENAA